MVKPKPLIIIALCLAAGLVGFFIFHQTDAEKIRGQLDDLSELVSKDGVENKLTAAANAKKIGEIFTDPCTFEVPQTPYRDISGRFSRQDVRAYAMSGRASYQQILFEIYDISINFPNETTASVRLTARLKTGENGGPPFDEFNELVCEFIKIEDDWYISQVSTVEVLEK